MNTSCPMCKNERCATLREELGWDFVECEECFFKGPQVLSSMDSPTLCWELWDGLLLWGKNKGDILKMRREKRVKESKFHEPYVPLKKRLL